MGEVIDGGMYFRRRARQSANEFFEKALALEASDDLTGAAESYGQALEFDPEHSEAHVNLGVLLYRFGNFEAAKDHFFAATVLDPDNFAAHYDLGSVLDEMGDCDAAMIELQTALRQNPFFADAHFNLARLYGKKQQPGWVNRAIYHFKAYLRLGSSECLRLKARSAVQSLEEEGAQGQGRFFVVSRSS